MWGIWDIRVCFYVTASLISSVITTTGNIWSPWWSVFRGTERSSRWLTMGITKAGVCFFKKHTIPFLLSPPPEMLVFWVWLGSRICIFRRFPGDSDKPGLWPTGTLPLTSRQRNICLGILGLWASSCRSMWEARLLCGRWGFSYELTISHTGYSPWRPMSVCAEN